MKIAIYYDSLDSIGGAERTVIMLANHLKADIITSGFNPELKKWMPIDCKIIDIGNVTLRYFKPLGILFEAPLRYFFMRKRINYDVNIYCGFTSIYAAHKSTVNIWHCLTPNRIIYDMKKYKLKHASLLKKIALYIHILLFQKLDQKIVKYNFNEIITQSINTQKRVKQYYGIDSKVIYDPVEINNFYFESFGDYYLTVSRLFPEKRVNLIVNAFKKMPNKKLIIVGEGPDKKKILEEISNVSNIKILSNINDNKLRKLYANCFAAIYMPKDEDYGLVPLEVNASGKVCIAVNEGGCRETVIDGKTGFLINSTEEDLINLVNRLEINKVKQMKNFCLIHARKFDISNCTNEWKKLIRLYTN